MGSGILSTSGSCSCSTGYALSGGACNAVTCSFSGVTGVDNGTTVNYAASTHTQSCNTSEYYGSVSYTCSEDGVINVSENGCSDQLPSQCTNYTSRNFDETYVGIQGTAQNMLCHAAGGNRELSTGWYRFSGTYKKLAEQGAYAHWVGQTAAPGFLQSSHPSTVGQNVSAVVGFNWSGIVYWRSDTQPTAEATLSTTLCRHRNAFWPTRLLIRRLVQIPIFHHFLTHLSRLLSSMRLGR